MGRRNKTYSKDLHQQAYDQLTGMLAFGESKKEARDRVLKELDALAAAPYQVAGAAIHGGTMGQLLNYYHVPYAKIPNCAALHLVYEDGNWRAEGGIV